MGGAADRLFTTGSGGTAAEALAAVTGSTVAPKRVRAPAGRRAPKQVPVDKPSAGSHMQISRYDYVVTSMRIRRDQWLALQEHAFALREGTARSDMSGALREILDKWMSGRRSMPGPTRRAVRSKR
jgi:hypothetical protein